MNVRKLSGWVVLVFVIETCLSHPQPAAATISQAPAFQQRMVELINAERAKANLLPVKIHPSLIRAAIWMVNDMATHNAFGHTDSRGQHSGTRVIEGGYTGFSNVGENIAGGQLTPEEAMDGFMHSAGHRAAILDPIYTDIGIGYVKAQIQPMAPIGHRSLARVSIAPR